MDYPYVFFIFIIIGLTYYSFVNPQKDLKCFNIAAILVFLLLGLRAPAVGNDTLSYYRFFTGAQYTYNLYDARDLEPFFLFYNQILRYLLFKNGQLFMIVNAFFSLSMIYVFIKQYSSRKTLSILLFFFIIPYGVYFVALRQILGVALIMFGLWYLMNKKKTYRWAVFILCSFLGWGLHSFSLIAAFVYLLFFIIRIPNKKIAYLCLIVTALMGLIIKDSDILGLLRRIYLFDLEGMDRLSIYMSGDMEILKEDSFSLLIYLRYTIVALLGVWLMPEDKMNNPLTGIYIAGICLYNIFSTVFLILRIVFPFWIFGIIVLTWGLTISNTRYLRHKVMVNYIVFFILAYFTQAYVKTQIYYEENDKTHPYYFFFQDYSKHPSMRVG